MATIAQFQMKVVGEKPNVESFVSALEQKGKFCMGRGGVIDVEDDFDGGSILYGKVKWSLFASLIGDAVSMRKQKESGKGHWMNINGFIDNHEFITLPEASELIDVDVEAYSAESGLEFAEHILVKKGVTVIDNCVPYQEVWCNEYVNYEEFSQWCPDLAKEIGKQEFEKLWKSGSCRIIGGFESTEFSI